MSMKHHYALITESDEQKFVNGVNSAMNDGWVPLGGVAVIHWAEDKNNTDATCYAQAMVRRGVNGIEIVH